jgi:hypothetical protein
VHQVGYIYKKKKKQLVTVLWAGCLGFESVFLSIKTPRRALGPTQLPIQWVLGSNPDVKPFVHAVNDLLGLRLRIGKPLPHFLLYPFMA